MSPNSKSRIDRLVEENQSEFTVQGPVFRDKSRSFFVTSFLHRWLPISVQHQLRDNGFRTICDGGVVLTAAVTAVFQPKLARRFLEVGRRRRDHRYGSHPRQVVEVVQGAPPSEEQSGTVPTAPKLLIFVHGGAWGSGSPWMYRLMVDRLSRLGYTVASIGYRIYPDTDINGQVDDVAAGVRWISDNIAEMGFDTSSPDVFLTGHSSGAHIAHLFLVRRAEAEAKANDNAEAHEEGGESKGSRLELKGFIGLSGVYDVYRHYFFESWRGVQEISPMKAAHGWFLHELLQYSYPRLFLSAYQGYSQSRRGFDKKKEGGLRWRLPRSLLVHGIADTTVPFFQTTSVAAGLRALSVPTTVHLEPGGEHFDTVGDLMFKEGSAVETAILRFTTAEAMEKDRAEYYSSIVSRLPRSRL